MPFRVRDGERVLAERFFDGGVKVAPTCARDEIGEEVDVDPTSHEATTAPVDVLKHWTPLPISPVETRTCAPSAEVSKMPPVLTNDFEVTEENGEEDEGEAIWNGAETPANAEVALNSPDASNVAASPSHAMAKISFAAQNLRLPISVVSQSLVWTNARFGRRRRVLPDSSCSN